MTNAHDAPPPLAAAFLPASRAIRRLRPEIEAATARPLASFAAAPALWAPDLGRASGVRLLRALGRPVLAVAPGPVLTPYDGLANSLTSLRLEWCGAPLGGEPDSSDLAALLRLHRLAGSNRAPDGVPEDALAGRPVIALIDPRLAAAPRRLRAFLRSVLAASPDAGILAAGPDGCGTPPPDLPSRLVVLRAAVDPWPLFERAARVLVADWEAGCEAALAGAPVICVDPAAGPAPADMRGWLALRYGAGVHGFDPWTRQPIPLAEAVERAAWLRGRFRGNDRRIVMVGVSGWKRAALDVLADGPAGPALHAMTTEEAVGLATLHGAQVRAWATRMPGRLAERCTEAGLPLARIEDGFLRSVGLGASLKPGASIVVDDRGIYYDPRTESRLETILRETAFDPAVVARAGRLREAIVARRLSKYNVGLSAAAADWPTDRRIVLVPGQVEDDASVRSGSPQVRSNLGLLRAARARNPDAFLLYKPHPDVEAGFRPGAIPEAEALRLADRIVGGLAIVDLLDRAHHVETMTSLAGFEALIRGLTVAAHGRPFYAGWGLTADLAPGADRGRRLALDELVAGALLLYPVYLDPVAMKPCTAEQLLDRLSAARAAAPPTRLALSGLQLAAMRARYAALNPLVRRLRRRRGVRGADDRPA